MRKKEQDTETAEPFASPAPASSGAPAALSPLDIQQKEFRYARFGGYKMRDVDEFLDRVTEAMSTVVADNERLRAGGGASASPVLGTPDLDDVGRQADEIIQRARDEAAGIVAEARARAAEVAGVVAAGTATADQRAAINAFLAREKEFLQSLAGLVQDHAGSVKEMAKEARSKVAAAPAPTLAAATPAAAPAAAVLAAPKAPTPTSAPTPPAASTPPTPAPAETTISLPHAEERVLSGEPATAAARRDGGDDDARDGGDSSLRELFWGEE